MPEYSQASIDEMAAHLVNNPVFEAGTQSLREYYMRKILNTRLEEVDVREEHYRLILVLDSLKTIILSWAHNDTIIKQKDHGRRQAESIV